MTAPYAWAGDIHTFVDTPEEDLLEALTRFTKETRSPHLFAWYRSIAALQQQFSRCLPDLAGIGLILEYELPRSGGRRPDLIILENGIVLVIEFKNRVEAEPADFDQVLGYVRDLESYHAGCRDRRLVPVLIPIGMRDAPFEHDGVHVIPPSALVALVRRFSAGISGARVDIESWTSARHDPLPNLIEAARLLFERQPLPRIKQAESARIPETIRLLESITEQAWKDQRRDLVFLTGVPGSGKTLVGLQLVHSRNLPSAAVFVSGNGPLIQVMQYALGGGKPRREFVLDLRSFLRDNLKRPQTLPRERIVVFDEAQRAWDRDRVLIKHKGSLVGSEPELLIRIADRAQGEPFVLVALVGEGQEIHAGEEAGIGQWVDALKASHGWEVFAPAHLAEPFQGAGIPVKTESLLNLTMTLRSHRASKVAHWVDYLLNGKIKEASTLASELWQACFVLYASRDLETIRQYVWDRYASNKAARYGLLVSSKFRNVDRYGVRALRSDYWYYGEWYEEGPSHPRSGCRLEMAVTEFGCQGLELDMPIVCWGPDLTWSDDAWRAKTGKARYVRDPFRLRLNAYRVLLTRGRDGVCLFVPPESFMDRTYDMILSAGVRELA